MVSDTSKQDKIKEFEKEISKTKYNKATQGHIGLVKAKIAKLKQEVETRARSAKKGEGYAIRKNGDASVALLGFPSVGKSTLLNQLTSAQSKTAAYAFTTLTAIPGMLEHRGAKIQIVDIPGLVEGAAEGSGRGKEVLGVIRAADLIVMMVDIFALDQAQILLNEVYESGIRIDEDRPRIVIKPQARGGIKVGSTVKLTHLDNQLIEAVLKEFKITNADIVLREDASVDRLIDAVEGNRVYIPSLMVINKIDAASKELLESTKKRYPNAVYIAAEKKINLDALKDAVYSKLRFIRIYLKEPGKKTDKNNALILRTGTTIRGVCEKIHRDFVRRFRYAKVWGKSAKFPGQKFTLEHIVMDDDEIEITLK